MRPDAGLGHADERVGGHHAQVAGQRELHRAADARAVDLADRRLGHLLQQVPRLEDRAAELAQAPGSAASAARPPKSMPAENIGARAAHHDAEHVAVGGGRGGGLADREDQLVVERVALLGAVEDEVADRAAVFGLHEAHGQHHDCFGLASRPFHAASVAAPG